MELINRNIITIAITSMLMSNTVSAKDLFVELESEKKYVNSLSKEKVAEFHLWLNNYLDGYEQWRDAYINDLDIYRSALIEQWGRGDVSDKNKYVEYSDDNQVKKVIDYDNNTVTISVLTDEIINEKKIAQLVPQKIDIDGINVNLSQADKRIETVNYSFENERKEKRFVIDQIESQMQQLDIQAERLILAETGIPSSFIYQRSHDKKEKLLQSGKKRLLTIVDLYKKKRTELGIERVENKPKLTTSETNNKSVITSQSKMKIEILDSTSKKEFNILAKEKSNDKESVIKPKKIVSYNLLLPANSLQKRAAQYQAIVDKESKRWLIDSALIMAIIHSESSFKSNAKSYIPAYGLMQVVPTSAGHDVNKYIHKIDAPMEVSDLYVPLVNVETGSAYLNILNNRYLKAIINEQSRMYCMIAAYNTGAGNVARAFNKDRSTNINKASIVINSMSSQQVYDHLLKNLPYDETKNYLKKVNNRIALYK